MIRLGGPIHAEYSTPEQWVAAVQAAGYRAAPAPVGADADDATVKAYVDAAAKADIVIAEVGAWSNPLSPDDATRAQAMERCRTQLDLAERLGARCCVNIAGSRGAKWDGPSPDDLSDETFDMIVATVRDIIDAVKPARTFYTLETMPWMYPDSTESYLHLLAAIDRPAFAVHFDPVNIICSPQRYFTTGIVIGEFVAALGPHIKSCHAKDIILRDNLTTHLDEVRPGTGFLDYVAFLSAIHALPGDVPVMLEHLSKPEEYTLAAEHIRTVAGTLNIPV
jgi:sugar phosphate isomerase/epimerase